MARDTATFHPTQKPVELATRAILNSSDPGDIILDLFGGSGFTLIGAEMTERQARLVELSPTYCDGIIRRYVSYTGNAGVTCTRDEATVEEDRDKIWDNRDAWKNLNVLNGTDLVEVVLKSGEKDEILAKLDEISGYQPTMEDVAKN